MQPYARQVCEALCSVGLLSEICQASVATVLIVSFHRSVHFKELFFYVLSKANICKIFLSLFGDIEGVNLIICPI